LFYFCLFVNIQFRTWFFLYLITTFDSSSRITDVCANRQFLEGRTILYRVLTIFIFPFELVFTFIFSCLWVILTIFFVMLLLASFAFISSHKIALLLYRSFPFFSIRRVNFSRTSLQIEVSSCLFWRYLIPNFLIKYFCLVSWFFREDHLSASLFIKLGLSNFSDFTDYRINFSARI
jgi:hypothetical protein